jgi:RND family efflux transporter MFP subunit
MATRDTDLSALRIDRTSYESKPPRKSKRRRKLFLWLALMAAFAAILLVAGRWLTPALEVQLVSASLTSPAQASAVLTASGYVVARRKAAVASKGTGRLVYLGVQEGDKVEKGQVIARLEDSDVIAALNRERQNLRLAEADRDEARKNLERTTILLKQGAIAQVELDVADARYKRVVATIEAAKYALREAEVAVENTRIVAPFDGTVLKKNADVGEIVAPLAGAASSKAAVVTIADMSSLEVEADVAEANITRVKPQQNCEITLDAYPQHRYPGMVANIVPTADRAKATVLVKIAFKRYDERVLPEMGAKVTFLAEGASTDPADIQPVLTVPSTAVANRDGQPTVFRAEDDRAVAVPVTTGRQLGQLIEINAGLKEGDKVIRNAGGELKNGSKIAIKSK